MKVTDRIWIISPYGDKSAKNKSYKSVETKSFEEVWSYDLSNHCIAIGSSFALNPVGQSRSEIQQEIQQNNKESWTPQKCSRKAGELSRFYNEIREGDFVIAKRGLKIIIGFGKVFSKGGATAFYSVKKGIERTSNFYNPHPNFLNVHWKEDHLDFGRHFFRMGRFYELDRSRSSKQLNIIESRIVELLGNGQTEKEKSKKEPCIEIHGLPSKELSDLVKAIKELRGDAEHKERAHESLVEKFYVLLGYELFREIKHRQGRIDLSISVDKDISIVTEVKKGWGLTAQDEIVRGQAYNYAHDTGARYVVITNGDYYGVFDRRKGDSYASQFVGDFQLSLLRLEDNETIQLLRKKRL